MTTAPIREIPLMWPDDTSSKWSLRVLLDRGEGSDRFGRGYRYAWKDTGQPATEADVEMAARLVQTSTETRDA